MRKLVVCICGFVSLGLIGASAGELPGVPVFGDDFNVKGLFVENWNATKGAGIENGRAVVPANNNITLRRISEGNFAFSADITVEKPKGKIGHCGVIVDGIHFMVVPNKRVTANTAYRVPGEKRSRGNSVPIPKFKFGEPVGILVTREKLGKGYKYTYKLNGDPVDSFTVIMPTNGRISFYGYRTNMTVDNFQLYKLKKGNGSNNLVVNSSFEHLQEGMPNYMRPFLGGKYKFDGKWLDFLKNFAIDTEEKVSGKRSVRMTVGKEYPKRNGVGTYNVNVMANAPVTFSIYLKASRDDFPATMNLWELYYKNHQKRIKLSKEWKRYVFTVEKPSKAIVRGSVVFSEPGTVWADDIQIEIGDKPTKYMPSSLDKDKFGGGARRSVEIEEDILLPKMPTPPVVDGVLENSWFENAVATDKFFRNDGEPPANKTVAYLACDDENLYVAVRAFVPDVSKVKATKSDRDNLSIHGDDCVEVFLDTSFDRTTYYHLTTNAAGSRTDMGLDKSLSWNGDWTSAAKINEKEKSIDYEMRFPLRMFAGLDLAGKWGLNIGRNDTAAKKVYSLTHTKECNFHVPAIFPAIVFPEGVVEKYKIGFRKLNLLAGADKRVSVAGVVGNLSGKSRNAEIKITAAKTGGPICDGAMELAPGNSEFVLPSDLGPNTQAVDALVKILVDGKALLSQPRRLALSRQLTAYTRRNYYMNEDKAVLVGSAALPNVRRLDGVIKVAGKTIKVKMEPEFAFDIPLKDVPCGIHKIVLKLFKRSDEIASCETTLVKRPFKKGATQIDRQRRCLVVDGKPYLAIAPFFGVNRGIKPEEQDMVLGNMLRLHNEMGYKCFLVGAVDDGLVPKQAQRFIDLCARNGIKVIYWPFLSWRHRDKIKPEQRLKMVTGDNIIACMVVDEPELYAKSDEVEKFMDEFRAASPYMPIFMNNTLIGIPGRFAGLKTDILMLDDYLTNRENRKVKEMVDATRMMRKAGEAERLPVFYFLSGENLHNHYRELTYVEQVAETYGVVIAGATGVSYFCSLPLYPEDYRACVDVNRELLSLEDVIFSLEKTSKAKITDPVVISMTRKLDGKIYVIALNSDNDRPADVEITLPAEFKYAETAEVKFENRKVKVVRGRMTDKFKPLERHVYVVEIAE